jgi:membrane fusion protein (multidrug efflux system)
MRFKQLPLIPIVLVLAACSPSNGNEKGGKGHGPMGGMPPASEVTVMTAAVQSMPVTFEYVGQTAGSREVEVRARVTGILLSRNFKEGQRVTKGQSLFTIDPKPFEAALARAVADVAAAEARLEQSKRNAARLKPLYAEKAVSQKEHDDAVSAEQIGAADVAAARARLTEARLNLEYTKVEAPVSGISTRALPSEGTLVSGPSVLLTSVVQVDPIWVNFGIPDNERARLQKEVEAGRLTLPKNGNVEVALRLADGSMYPHTGRLNFSDVRISTATGSQEARAELPNKEGDLRPGQFVRVVLRGATRPNAVAVPQRAVLEGPQGKFVYVVNDKSAAEPRPVEVGDWAGDTWIITSGLKGGEQVIVDGVMKIGPGAPVKVAEKPAERPVASKQPEKPVVGKK